MDDDESVLIIFGDCIYDSQVPAARQLIEAYEQYRTPIIGLAEVAEEDVSKFGVIAGEKIDARDWKVTRIVEKPTPKEAPSRSVAVGKYIITHEVFETLATMNFGKSGEIRLADAFDRMLEKGSSVYGRMLDGEWLDTGDKFNFLKTTIHFGLKHPEVGDKLRQYLQRIA